MSDTLTGHLYPTPARRAYGVPVTQPPDATQPVNPVPPAPPGTGTQPMPPLPPPPPAGRRTPADDAPLIRAVLAVLVVGLTVLALGVMVNGQRGYSDWTTWAVFATVVAAAHLVPLVWRTEPRRVWDLVAIATGGLVFYWVAIVLPFIGLSTSFAQTLAVACALAHLWLLPGRR
jgi:hypothetical protein